MEDNKINNRKHKTQKSKKIKIIGILTIVFIVAGISFLVYPYITNFFSEQKQIRALKEWDKIEEPLVPEDTINDTIISSEDNESQKNQDFEDNDSTEIDYKIIDAGDIYITGIIDKTDYKYLSAEDFFPLKISIPKIDLDWLVNEGTDTRTLRQGPGHIVETVLPGDTGRCVISGHRTTYGAPFNKIDELKEGDLIYLETLDGKIFAYVVTGLIIVNPEDVYIIEGDSKKELLLTTCEPKYSAAKRLVIVSELINIYAF